MIFLSDVYCRAENGIKTFYFLYMQSVCFAMLDFFQLTLTYHLPCLEEIQNMDDSAFNLMDDVISTINLQLDIICVMDNLLHRRKRENRK